MEVVKDLSAVPGFSKVQSTQATVVHVLGNQQLLHRPSSRVCIGNLQELLQRPLLFTCSLMATILEVGTVRQSAGSGADLVDVRLADGQNQAISAIAHGSTARGASLVPGMYCATESDSQKQASM